MGSWRRASAGIPEGSAGGPAERRLPGRDGPLAWVWASEAGAEGRCSLAVEGEKKYRFAYQDESLDTETKSEDS